MEACGTSGDDVISAVGYDFSTLVDHLARVAYTDIVRAETLQYLSLVHAMFDIIILY